MKHIGKIVVGIVILLIGLIYLTFNKMIKKSSQEAETETVSPIRHNIDFSTLVSDEVLKNIDKSKVDSSLSIVQNARYKVNDEFVFEYTGQYKKDKNGGQIPHGLVYATNIGLDPSTNKSYNTIIEGQFENGLPNGYCIMTTAKSEIFKGLFSNGQPNGKGLYYSSKDAKPIQVNCNNGDCH